MQSLRHRAVDTSCPPVAQPRRHWRASDAPALLVRLHALARSMDASPHTVGRGIPGAIRVGHCSQSFAAVEAESIAPFLEDRDGGLGCLALRGLPKPPMHDQRARTSGGALAGDKGTAGRYVSAGDRVHLHLLVVGRGRVEVEARDARCA